MNDNFWSRTSRRDFITLAGTAALLNQSSMAWAQAASQLSVGALFAGKMMDKGFMEAGWLGLEKARTELGIKTTHIEGPEPKKEPLAAALTSIAQSGVDMVIAHGGQNNEAATEVAAKFPKLKFVVTQGNVTGPNLSSYDVLQEESAYLAGVLAALSTRTGVVGHMSGIRVVPGLKGRAGFAAGVHDTDPKVKLLTNFSGFQDDNALSKRVALAEIAGGADIIFSMLNAGRDGAVEACREKGARHIGNVIDWVKVDPKVFIASAVADVGIGVFHAARDLKEGKFQGGKIVKIGLSDPAAVRLTMASDVAPAVRARVEKAASDIVSGKVHVSETYSGPEFANPAA
jgi:basic membrane protein A and related proteins